ncbi:MAG: hypothetical protein OEM01_02395 [Desulfobulbaceae bacterium]|nr:hypothetical protein [Desulfobulbaceae bacterium]
MSKGVTLPWTHEQISTLMGIFPEGQICIEDNGRPVAVALSLVIDFSLFGEQLTYDQIIREELSDRMNLRETTFTA